MDITSYFDRTPRLSMDVKFCEMLITAEDIRDAFVSCIVGNVFRNGCLFPFECYIHLLNLFEFLGEFYRNWQQNDRILGFVSRSFVTLTFFITLVQ